MTTKMTSVGIWMFAVLLLTLPFHGYAARLEVDNGAPLFLHLLAATAYYLHIGGGAVGIFSGVLASVSKKGSKAHRFWGKLFFISMAVCYGVAAIVAPLLDTQQSTNFVAAILALYLLTSGVSAARRRNFVAGKSEVAGMISALAITALGVIFMLLSYNSPDGSFDGSPPQAYVLFILAGGAAAIGDLRAIRTKHLSNQQRTIRHLWRMCMSFFIAAGSLFFGQAQFFPEAFNATLLPVLFGFFPLIVMLIYLLKFAYTGFMASRTKRLAKVH